MPLTRTLIGFTCPGCRFTEEIGIGITTGVLIKGTITLICPKCGHMLHAENQVIMSPPMIQNAEQNRGF